MTQKKTDVQTEKQIMPKTKLLFGITICPTDEGADIVMIDIIEFRCLELYVFTLTATSTLTSSSTSLSFSSTIYIGDFSLSVLNAYPPLLHCRNGKFTRRQLSAVPETVIG